MCGTIFYPLVSFHIILWRVELRRVFPAYMLDFTAHYDREISLARNMDHRPAEIRGCALFDRVVGHAVFLEELVIAHNGTCHGVQTMQNAI